ncbi:unnamed protein product [Pylaiella littoralis]
MEGGKMSVLDGGSSQRDAYLAAMGASGGAVCSDRSFGRETGKEASARLIRAQEKGEGEQEEEEKTTQQSGSTTDAAEEGKGVREGGYVVGGGSTGGPLPREVARVAAPGWKQALLRKVVKPVAPPLASSPHPGAATRSSAATGVSAASALGRGVEESEVADPKTFVEKISDLTEFKESHKNIHDNKLAGATVANGKKNPGHQAGDAAVHPAASAAPPVEAGEALSADVAAAQDGSTQMISTPLDSDGDGPVMVKMEEKHGGPDGGNGDEQPVSPLLLPWATAAAAAGSSSTTGNCGDDISPLPRGEPTISSCSAWARKPPVKPQQQQQQRRRQQQKQEQQRAQQQLRKLQQQRQEQKQQQPPRSSKTHAVPWRRNPNPAYRPPPPSSDVDEGKTSEVADGNRAAAKVDEVDVRQGEERGGGASAEMVELPAFMRPGGGMVPVAFVTGCDAATIAPGSESGCGCKSTLMLLGYTAKNLIELVEPGETGEVVWRSRKSLVNTVKQSVGAKAFGWLRRRKNDEKEGKTSESIPPEAIAGLYLRETPDRRLAIIISSSSNALDREDGVDGGASYDDGGLSGVEFGVVLEGSSSVSGAEEGQEKGGVNEVGETFGGEGSLGTTTSGPGENAGIEMMELGGVPHEEEREERYAALLTRDGRLCVFGTRGGVRCASSGVHRWVTHVS